jgi:hypothetical protein
MIDNLPFFLVFDFKSSLFGRGGDTFFKVFDFFGPDGAAADVLALVQGWGTGGCRFENYHLFGVCSEGVVDGFAYASDFVVRLYLGCETTNHEL